MPTRDGLSRTSIATVLAALLLTLSVAVPLMDRGMAAGPHAISEGPTPSGWVDHDHRICLQHSAMAWLPGFGIAGPAGQLRFEAEPGIVVPVRPASAVRFTHNPRAPPRL